jgi:AraC-like DNA-binding protein
MKNLNPTSCDFPLIRVAYLNLFMDILGKDDRDNPAFLQRFNLPPNLAGKPDAYLPLRHVWSVVQWQASNIDVEEFTVRLSRCLRVAHFSKDLCNTLQRAPSLGSALEQFAKLANRELSDANYRLVRNGDEVRICSSVADLPVSDFDRIDEWLRILSLMTVIRHFTGDGWMPQAIMLRSHHEPGATIRNAFPRTDIYSGRAETIIKISASLLNLATTRNYRHHVTARITRGGIVAGAAPDADIWSFPAALQEIVQTYLDDGYPDINSMANVIGCSVRTLQRRLQQFDLSYTDIVQRARFSVATDLLRDPETRVIDAAIAVGYDDPSHFTRAFKRLAGISPNQYRKLNHVP